MAKAKVADDQPDLADLIARVATLEAKVTAHQNELNALFAHHGLLPYARQQEIKRAGLNTPPRAERVTSRPYRP